MRPIDADALIAQMEADAEQMVEPIGKMFTYAAINDVKHAPTIEQPEIIRCKDCKHWRDSDGVYRRGIDAESKCPLNTQEVYAGTFYCGQAERRDENVNADTR